MKPNYSLAAVLQLLLWFSKNKLAAIKKLILFVIAIVYFSYIHAQTLVAYYPLNGNAKDSSGNHYDGTISGGVSPDTDRNGNANNALRFNGVDGRIDVSDNPALRPASFTVSAWFYLSDTPTWYKYIVAKNICNDVYESFGIYIDPSGKLTGDITDESSIVYVYAPVPAPNQWHLATLSFNDDHDSLKLYLDGVLYGAVKTLVKVAYNKNSFSIGYELERCANNFFFDGKIDEVRLYNGALSDKQVSDLYDSTTQKSATLVAYYPLNHNAKDSGGSHYDGTITGGVSFAADRKGKANNAAAFNGVDGRIDVPDKPAFRPQSFTASAWFYLDATPSRYKTIVGKNLCNGAFVSFAIYINLSGHLSGVISDGVNSVYVEYTSLSLYTWHLATMTYDYTHNSLKLYLDGQVVSAANTHLQIAYDNNSFAIGDQLENCANNYFFHGRIDEVRLYDGALTDKQVSDLYDIIQKPPTLIAYYPLNGNAKDSSGNHYDGTNTSVSFSTDRNGNSNSAGEFNGVNGRIDVPDNPALRPQSFTVSAWFYLDATPSRYKIIVGKNLCDGVLESFAIYINLQGHLSGTVSNGTNSAYVEYTTPSLYTWHLATMTYDYTSGYLKLYLDGEVVSTVNAQIKIDYDNNSFAIGYQLENCANDYFWHGRIDEVRLYNGALSNSQVYRLYDSTMHATAQFASFDTASSVADEINTERGKNVFNVIVFPNPVASLLNIYINPSKESVYPKGSLNINPASIKLSKATLQVVGIAGNVIISKQVDAFNRQNMVQLNVSQLVAGAYFIKIISADGREASVVKFEKQ